MLREEKAKIRTVEASEKFRSAGNKAFQQRQFDVAAAYYTEAIAAAPKDSISLALAHANRASTCTRPNTFVEVIPIVYIIPRIICNGISTNNNYHRLAIMIAC